jgi:hypothetical protein
MNCSISSRFDRAFLRDAVFFAPALFGAVFVGLGIEVFLVWMCMRRMRNRLYPDVGVARQIRRPRHSVSASDAGLRWSVAIATALWNFPEAANASLRIASALTRDWIADGQDLPTFPPAAVEVQAADFTMSDGLAMGVQKMGPSMCI